MSTAKVTTKKTPASVKKPVRKPVAKKVTLDDVWETIDRIGKAHAETEKAMKENQEAMKEVRESIKETRRIHEETEKTLNKAIGGLSNTLGSLIQHIMTPDLPRKFKQFGFTFDRITTVKWAGGENNIYAEIDGLLENGKQAMVVEVKTTLHSEDVDDHLARMEKVRRYAGLHGDRREFLGALAAAIIDKSAREYALKKGFFVIEPSGEDMKITKPPSERVWRQ
jgi:seryl-tRNA synthetase